MGTVPDRHNARIFAVHRPLQAFKQGGVALATGSSFTRTSCCCSSAHIHIRTSNAQLQFPAPLVSSYGTMHAGAGSVGTATVQSLIRDGNVSDIYLLDVDEERCVGEVLDLSDVGFMHNCRVHVGTYEDARRSDIVVITAGAKQKPGEARTELISRNAQYVLSVPAFTQLTNPRVLIAAARVPHTCQHASAPCTHEHRIRARTDRSAWKHPHCRPAPLCTACLPARMHDPHACISHTPPPRRLHPFDHPSTHA